MKRHLTTIGLVTLITVLAWLLGLMPAQAGNVQPSGHGSGGGGSLPDCPSSLWANLPGSPSVAQCFFVTNAQSCVAGTAVTTSGTTGCTLTWTGTGWYPAGNATSAASASAGGSAGNPQYNNAGSFDGTANTFYIAPGAISSSTFSSNCSTNPCIIKLGPGTYTVAAPLTWGTSHDQTLECDGATIQCTDTTGGRDCLDEDVHGHFVGSGPGDGGAGDGCIITDASTANITSLISNASKTAADGFDLRNVLLDPSTSSTISKGELWLSGAEGFNTVDNVRFTQPPVGGSNSGIIYAVDDAGGTRQWNQIDNNAVSVTCGAAAGATGINIAVSSSGAGAGGSNFTFVGGAVVDCGTTSKLVNISGNSTNQVKNVKFVGTYFEPDGSGDDIDITDGYAIDFDDVYFNQANASTQTNCVSISGQAGNTGIVHVSGRSAPSACTNVINNSISGFTRTTSGNIDYTYPGTNGGAIRIVDGSTQFNSFGPQLYYSVAGTALPSCAAAVARQIACVSDETTACTVGNTYSGSGSNKCQVQCNTAGSLWKVNGVPCY